MKFQWAILLLTMSASAVNHLSFSNQIHSPSGSKFAMGSELGFVYRSASSLNFGLWLMDLGSTGSVPNLFQKHSIEFVATSDAWLIRGLGSGKYELRILDLRGSMVSSQQVEIVAHQDFIYRTNSLPRTWYVIQLLGPQFYAKTVRL